MSARQPGRAAQPARGLDSSDFPLKKDAPSGKQAALMSDATRLMLATKGGDGGAFDELVRMFRGRAFRVAHGLVGSRDEALDLSQEAFLKVFRARGTFRDGDPFLPWFHRILRNTCFSYLRQRGRLRALSVSGARAGEEDEGDWELADADAPAPSAQLEANERAGAFRDAFAALSARDREIITLRHFQELSYREIADSLAIPQGTVMSRLFHARRRLRERLADVLDELPDEDESGRGSDDRPRTRDARGATSGGY